MLNRTNRTLSANLNRLYLETRSLVANASETNGKLTLRARFAHADFPRVGMSWIHDPSSIQSRRRARISDIPNSSLIGPWSVPGREVEPVAVVPPVMPRPAFDPICAFGTTGQGGTTQAQNQTWTWPALTAGQVKRDRSLKCDGRKRREQDLYQGHARARAASTAAARVAAAGG
jgi:hypothetical protein